MLSDSLNLKGFQEALRKMEFWIFRKIRKKTFWGVRRKLVFRKNRELWIFRIFWILGKCGPKSRFGVTSQDLGQHVRIRGNISEVGACQHSGQHARIRVPDAIIFELHR